MFPSFKTTYWFGFREVGYGVGKVTLDQALALGSRVGWEQLTLNDLAGELDISRSDIYQYFSQKDDLVEAWFDRADRALLGTTPNPAWAPLGLWY